MLTNQQETPKAKRSYSKSRLVFSIEHRETAQDIREALLSTSASAYIESQIQMEGTR